MNTKTKLSALVSSIALLGILTLPAHASLLEKTKPESVAAAAPVEIVPEPTPEPSPEVTLEEASELEFDKPEVRTEPAPVVVQEVPEPEPAPVIPANTPAAPPVAPKVVPAPPAPPVQAPAPAPASTPVAAASGKAAVASAALGQIGVMQDCTMLVTNSLRSIGINFHGWPHEYFSLGTQISAAEAQPGDLIYYKHGSAPGTLAHIAVYIGNGQAVHGGWNGNETRIFSAQVGSGPVFIRLK